MDQAYLNSVGKIWSAKDIPSDVIENDVISNIVDTICSLISGENAKSILISGEKSTGKSTLIEITSKRLNKSGWMIFKATAGNIMAGQRYIGDLEQNIQNVIKELTSRKKNLWIVPRFQELYYGGRHEHSPVSILDQILPFVDNGSLKVIGEIDANNLEKVIQYRPQILNSFEVIRISPSDKDFTLDLAADWIEADASQLWADFTPKDLEELYYLAGQYLSYKENPGCVMDLLKQTKQLVNSKNQGKGIRFTDVIDALSNVTGMPSDILDDGEKLDLPSLKQHFSAKVIGQEEAVNTMVERIAMIKAGLTDPSKPAGVFLFVGPTGTGKTEIAKSMAEYLFGSEDSMIRMDMSEFQTADSTYKILGSTSDVGEDMALVNTIRRQPFSIVLLDEFEKAHPNIWDLFLQVFDDGRLTDQRGSVADFRHCIIILTSNLGASVPTGSKIGFSAEDDDINANVLKNVNQAFRPEFVNRLDRIVVFNPLTKAIAKQILKNELKKILQRRGLRRRSWEIDFEDSAIEFLLEMGFSKTLGARPLKRSIEKYLLSPLALTIVNHDFPQGDQFLLVSAGKGKLKVEFIDPDEPKVSWDQKKQMIEGQRKKAEALDLVTVVADSRGTLAEFELIKKELNSLIASTEEYNMTDRKSFLMTEMSDPEFWSSDDRFAVLNEVEFLDRFESGLETATRLFDRMEDPNQQRLSFDVDLMAKLAQKVYLLDHAFSAYQFRVAQDAILWVSYEQRNKTFADRIIGMYQSWARRRGMKMGRVHDQCDGGSCSEYFTIFGYGAYRILEDECGYHVLEVPDPKSKRTKKSRIRIGVIPVELEDYRSIVLASIEQRVEQLAAPKTVRRFLEGSSPLVKDNVRNWQTGKTNFILDGNFDLMKGG